MLVKRLLSNFMNANKDRKSPWAKLFMQYVKAYKKTGIKMREAMLLSPEGHVIVRDGCTGLTPNDIETMRSILVNGDACMDVLHLESLYYCVKELTDDTLVLFNGASYVIACLTNSNHLLVVSIRARKADGARTVAWMQNIASDLKIDVDPQ